MTPKDIALAVVPPALWGIAYAVALPATQTFPPLFLAGICYALTAIALFRPWSGLQTSGWVVFVAATLGASIQSAFVFSGIALVPASMATLVVQSQVPFAVLAAWVIGQERLNLRRAVGIAIAISGVAILVGMPNSVGDTRGLLMIVAGTLTWGIAQGIIRARGHDPGTRLMGAMSALAAPQLLALSLVLETGQIESVRSATATEWVEVGVLALGGFVAAYSIWYGLLQRHRVDEIAPFILLMPLVGLAMAYLLLGERASLMVFVGAATILAGLALVVGVTGNSSKIAADD